MKIESLAINVIDAAKTGYDILLIALRRFIIL